jgi:predicted short-subunit dehydrogenase-like oxidoreductase (DUF2520 family)
VSRADGAGTLWVIGAGRAGLALGLLLFRARGAELGLLHFGGRRATPPAHPLFEGDSPAATYAAGWTVPAGPIAGVVIAVPDAALAEAAGRLAGARLPAGTPVLHLCGAQGAEVLGPVAAAGCAIGALHPLAAVADPVEGADRLRGVWWGVEAEGEALLFAGRIVAAAEGRMLRVEPGAKPLYHAAAVFASNYIVALLAVAEQLMQRAGAEPGAARAALGALAAGALANVAEAGPAAALTGPVVRGDVETLRLHLASLSDSERALYSPLARATLGLAAERGLDSEARDRIQRLLEEER